MASELVFPASKAKTAMVCVGCAAFVALGAWTVPHRPIGGWLCIVFFGVGLAVSLLMLIGRNGCLRLDARGFEIVSPFNKELTRWDDVAGFHMGAIQTTKMIAVVYRSGYTKQKAARALASSMSGMEGAIPNSYVASLDDVLAALVEWHARYVRPAA